jgi:hypothetical protein
VPPAYLVIQAEYNTKTNYYRIDFAKDRKYQPLLRNHGYNINIIGAKEGYQSFEEAQKAPMSDFNFSLTLDDSDNSDINEVIYLENQYMLGINVSQVLFDWDKYWIGGKDVTDATNATKYPLSVFTTYSGGWTATLSGASSWVTLEGTSGTKDTSGKVTINVTEENRTGAERKATLIIRAGMLVKEVTIRQSGGANSRMIYFDAVKNTATTRIPLAFAEAARGGNDFFKGISKDLSAFEAKIIWQETGAGQPVITVGIEGTGAIKDRVLVVTAKAGTKKSGNAVVAIIKKGSGIPFVGGDDKDEILWSWHIWCIDNDYMETDYHNPNVPLFIKRALGKYDSNQGLFYQWGRKDPFPKELTNVMPMDVANRPVAEADNFLNAIKDPAAFYHTKGTYSYWKGSSEPASDLWGKTKTYYDPCPVGWRVPDQSDKTYWTTGTAGDFLNGHLSEETGLWSDLNGLWTLARGTIFTPSASGTPGDGSSNSSAGYSVRCIKDIQLIKTSL